jgi:hypothetical protein
MGYKIKSISYSLTLIFLATLSINIFAVDYQITKSTSNIFITEPLLHSAGAPTADVLRKHGNYFNIWGWGAYGINNKLTFIYDWLVMLAGIPVGFLRYQLPSPTPDFSYALELYGVSFKRFDEDLRSRHNDKFEVYQKGWQGWAHLNTTYRISSKLRTHISAGTTYDTYQRYKPKEKAKFTGDKIYKNYYMFDLAAGFDYLYRKKLRISANYIQGNQEYIYDQDPHKWAIQAGIGLAPFINSTHGILRNMRIELWGYFVKFPDLHYKEFLPPIWPLISWQW